jgi:hypothetical protein
MRVHQQSDANQKQEHEYGSERAEEEQNRPGHRHESRHRGSHRDEEHHGDDQQDDDQTGVTGRRLRAVSAGYRANREGRVFQGRSEESYRDHGGHAPFQPMLLQAIGVRRGHPRAVPRDRGCFRVRIYEEVEVPGRRLRRLARRVAGHHM